MLTQVQTLLYFGENSLDNHIQNLNLGRYIVSYMVGNLVLWQRVSRAVKRDFQTYIQRYTFPNENCENHYPHSNALLKFCLKLDFASRVMLHVIQGNGT